MTEKKFFESEEFAEQFRCLRCGNCCRWHGYVNVSVEEIETIANFLSIDFDEYMEKFVILRHDRKGLSLDERANGDCIYYDDESKTCLIQEVKPIQCKRFPISWRFSGFENECAGAKQIES